MLPLSRHPRRILPLILAVLPLSSAWAGIHPSRGFALPNSGFDQGLDGWTAWSSGSSAGFEHALAPDGAASARATPGGTARAELRAALSLGTAGLPPADPSGFGAKIELCARVFFSSSQAGAASLSVLARTGSGWQTIAISPPASASATASGSWVSIATQPSDAFDARIPSSTSELMFVLSAEGPGPVFFDDVQAGVFSYASHGLVNRSFEASLDAPLGWHHSGRVRIASAEHLGREAYYGRRCAALLGNGPAALEQRVAIRHGTDTPRPGQNASAGAWIYCEDDFDLSPGSNGVELSVLAQGRGGESVLATRRRLIRPSERGRWLYLEASSSGETIGFDDEQLVVRVRKHAAGSVRVDFVQIGEPGGFDGNPRRHATASYVGWYRSPLSPHAQGIALTPRERWQNWAWLEGPFGDPSNTSLQHNPDCQTSPTCIRPNGRRDGAVSVESGEDLLPLAGTYDSRDGDILRFHIELAQAIGLDSFVYDWNGQRVAEQNANAGEDPINARTLEELVRTAEAPGCDFKVAIMYEPKVHMLGWVQGETTFEERKQGIIYDLIWFVENYSGRRPILHSRGKPVVFVFWHNVGIPGSSHLDEADWAEIRSDVHHSTGTDLLLIATHPPSDASTPFAGYMPWHLVGDSILLYSSYVDFLQRVPKVPAAMPSDVRDFAQENNNATSAWAANDDRNRVPVAMIWPGFDDSGVAGWSSANGTGSDGQPLRIRICSDVGGEFLSTCADAALESGIDWVHIATFNDWNELTAIEPAWNLNFERAALQGRPGHPQDVRRSLSRALEVQTFVASFKGQSFDPEAVEAAARAYLQLSRSTGVAYD